MPEIVVIVVLLALVAFVVVVLAQSVRIVPKPAPALLNDSESTNGLKAQALPCLSPSLTGSSPCWICASRWCPSPTAGHH